MFIEEGMETERARNINREVIAMLNLNRLKEAIEILHTDIDDLQDWALRTRFLQMKNSYDCLLEYLQNGMPDPGREERYRSIMGECYLLNDLIAFIRSRKNTYLDTLYFLAPLERVILTRKDLHNNYADTMTLEQLPPSECRTAMDKLTKDHEAHLDKLFITIARSFYWDKALGEEVLSIINDEELPVTDRSLVISALTLSCIKAFEPIKMLTLIKAAASKHIPLSARAITGMLIGLMLMDNRIEYYSEITAAIETLSKDTRIARRIATIQIQLLRCRETQKIDRKMREEIIPAIMKNPNIKDKMGIDIMREIEENDDINPEWAEETEKDIVKEKLEEMAQWQFEGVDIYMSTFSQLKKYPFFSELKNWFYPFDIRNINTIDIGAKNCDIKNSILWAICKSHIFCNSDKYSFLLTIKQLPQAQRDMLLQQTGNAEEIEEQVPDTIAKNDIEKEAELESNQYIQDLYRFFKLSPMRKDYTDPFEQPLNLFDSTSLKSLIQEAECILRTFNYLIDKGYYEEAVRVGRIYEEQEKGNAQFYQRMGYCLQKEGDYPAAIDYYTRADIIKPDTLWTLMHIAQCYRLAGDCDKAVSYYILAEDIAPDNISLLRQTGECFASLKQYNEAFSRLFKVEYLKPGSIKTMRGIAWCSFLTGKYEQAHNFYKRILKHRNAEHTDYLNAAHVEWVMHNNSTALELYREAKDMCGKEFFILQFDDDCDILAQHGIGEEECSLLRDLIIKE